MLRDPFAITNPFNFSSDQRTRLSLFVTHLDLLPGEKVSAVTAAAQDSNVLVYPLFVESVNPLPGVPGVSQVVVQLHPNLPPNQSVFVTVSLHGQTSNLARVRLK